MRPVLKAALHPLWRGPSTVQLGLDPERAVLVDGLQPSERALLHTLDGSLDTLDLDAGRVREGLVPERAHRLIALLERAGLLDDAGGPPSPVSRWDPQVQARLAPDLAALALAQEGRTDGGAAVLETRTRAWVHVHGAGRVGAAAARLLAASGVGRLTVEDPLRTRPGDLSPAGLGTGALGMDRGRATELACSADSPLPELPVPHGPRPDLVVLAPETRPDPLVVDQLARDGTVHLLVCMRETSVVVGPLVLPGVSACLRCLDLHRRDRDPGWPELVAQLVQVEQARAARGRAGPRVQACDTVLATLGAAAAVAHVLAHLAGAEENPARDGTVEYSLPYGAPRRRSWRPHPSCGCRWDSDWRTA